jgi:hypothetical protein
MNSKKGAVPGPIGKVEGRDRLVYEVMIVACGVTQNASHGIAPAIAPGAAVRRRRDRETLAW